MAVKKRCSHCLKVMENIGSAEKPQWVCNNTKKHKHPVYVPPLTDMDSAEDKAE